jgi:hypothetical protein
MTLRVQIVSFCAGAAALALVGMRIAARRRVSPEQRERLRRQALNASGRLGDALVTEAAPDALYYTYSVRGVQYTASQDIRLLRELLPADIERVIGPAQIKYAGANPANSMLVCEQWSGLRESAPLPGHAPSATSAPEPAPSAAPAPTALTDVDPVRHQAEEPPSAQRADGQIADQRM